MKVLFSVLVTLVFSTSVLSTLLFSTTVFAEGFSGNVSGYLGSKSLDKDDWDGYEDQTGAGLITDFSFDNWPVSIAVDIFLSASDYEKNDSTNKIEIDAYTSEIHLGLRKIWAIPGSRFSPYAGAGLAYINGRQEQDDTFGSHDENDSAPGGWFGAGIYWRPTDKLNVGLDVRYSQAEITLFDQDLKSGGIHSGLFIGYHW